jgi:hypothetical protein
LITQPGSVLFGVHGEYGKVILLFAIAASPATVTSRNKTEALTLRETLREATETVARQAQAAAAIPMTKLPFSSQKEGPR